MERLTTYNIPLWPRTGGSGIPIFLAGHGEPPILYGFKMLNKGFYNVANEPSFLSPNLYHWLGRPDLSNERIHHIIDANYSSKRDGIPGNDDSGAMSSWLAFHMMGLYPNAGQSYYLINTPYFKQTVIHQESGKDFVIRAKRLTENNKHIVSATLNGKPFNRAFIEHQDIVNGGILELKMGSEPSSLWGTEELPPSKSDNTL